MPNFLKLTLIFILAIFAACQENTPEAKLEKDPWNWGFNIVREQETVVLMTDMLKAENYLASVAPLEWLIRENPQLHPSIYEDGQRVYQGLINEAEDEAVRLRWESKKAELSRLQKNIFPGSKALTISILDRPRDSGKIECCIK